MAADENNLLVYNRYDVAETRFFCQQQKDGSFFIMVMNLCRDGRSFNSIGKFRVNLK